jgi:hypothetical protein
MTCDFYIKTNKCDHCGRHDGLKIGHSAFGWPFVCLPPKPHIENFSTWCNYIKDYEIYDEYGRLQNNEEFLTWIKSRQKHFNDEHFKKHYKTDGEEFEFISSDGYRFIKYEKRASFDD